MNVTVSQSRAGHAGDDAEAETGAIMEFSRRKLFGASAAVGLGLMLPPLRLATAANAAVPLALKPFTEQLPTLSDLGVIDATTGAPAAITMITTTHKFHSAMAPTPTFAYRASGGAQDYLGPIIVAKQGKPFDLTVTNNLGAHPLAFAIDPELVPSGTSDASSPRGASICTAATASRKTTVARSTPFGPVTQGRIPTGTPRRPQASGTTTTPSGSPASTCSRDWPAAI